MALVFFLIHSAILYLLFGASSPFTFKEIIDRDVLITILFTVFWLVYGYYFCCSFLLLFSSSYDLMTFFSVMFGFSLLCVYLLQVFGLWLP